MNKIVVALLLLYLQKAGGIVPDNVQPNRVLTSTRLPFVVLITCHVTMSQNTSASDSMSSSLGAAVVALLSKDENRKPNSQLNLPILKWLKPWD
jgi:hypothetical protein